MESQYLINRRNISLGLRAPEPPKEKKGIAKLSEKKKQEKKESKPQRDLLTEWFTERVKEMKGKCENCGCKIDKKIYAYAMMSVAHVLPKRKNMFPSVATHPDNWLELCTSNGCHGKYDTSWDEATEMPVWNKAVEKFKLVYPSIASEEKRHLPEVLRQEVL
jgi:hypothetical protein